MESTQIEQKELIILGGGAAGFFLAANLIGNNPENCVLLEKSKQFLQKVKISGGGRCNVTHACFDPRELVDYYPRGRKELLSLFHKFQPGDTMQWFEEKGVELKIESDNRVFPTSDSSQSIINALMESATKHVELRTNEAVLDIDYLDEVFTLTTNQKEYKTKKLVVTPGSSKQVWILLEKLGHRIIKPEPSLFTFNIPDKELHKLSGISFENAEVYFPKLKLESSGPLLITHWGLSGPAVLRLSAFGARNLAKLKYKAKLQINFISLVESDCLEVLLSFKNENLKAKLISKNPFQLPSRFWIYILTKIDLKEKTWQEVSEKNLRKLTEMLCRCPYEMNGKSTFKEEFVTAGGVDLKEIDFRNMQSKIVPSLFLAGEVLNIDGITGGFNFQACWSEAFVISQYLNKN